MVQGTLAGRTVGLNTEEVASEMYIFVNTVRTHLMRLRTGPGNGGGR